MKRILAQTQRSYYQGHGSRKPLWVLAARLFDKPFQVARHGCWIFSGTIRKGLGLHVWITSWAGFS
jgi:hypothetical protein